MNRAWLGFLIILALAALSLVMMSFLAYEAHSQESPKCMAFDKFRKVLSDALGERQIGIGMGDDGKTVTILFANEQTGTWTVLISDTHGSSCVADHGVGFSLTPIEKKGTPS